jgi:nitrogenase molybdenum-iron protein NifN
MISHFRDPIDIASSNFSEDSAIFGGERNFVLGIENVIRQYNPQVIGIATTCLSETIGDDVPSLLNSLKKSNADKKLPELIHVSTPSYSGTHAEGFQAAIKSIVENLAEAGAVHDGINIIAGMISPADLRLLKTVCKNFGINATLLPDYSDTLDGPNWDSYHLLPEGGTNVKQIRRMGSARATIQMNSARDYSNTAAGVLEAKFGVEAKVLPLPIGIRQTDLFMEALSEVSGKGIPEEYTRERGRLVDSYVDGHKYCYGKKAVVYGEEDWVVSVVAFLAETGVEPVLAISGGKSGKLEALLREVAPKAKNLKILSGADFEDMGSVIRDSKPDIMIGNSKGYRLSRELKIPLVRIGFPVHDRFGGARILHLGYAGTQQLFDRIINTFISSTQENGYWGYTYM